VNTEEYLSTLPRILFFTGKGGVGKTSLACATSVVLADEGKRVLLVSTDPASNLDEVLGTHLGNEPTAVTGASGLFALNIDPAAAARTHREQILGPYRGVLPDSALASMEEQLSGACTVEIAAFNEFAKLLGDPSRTVEYDYVIFDTAPTGHTLRLLSLPAAWSEFIATNTTGTSCLGPLQGLQPQQHLYEASLRNLADPALTRLVLVSRPEATALQEAARAHSELIHLGVSNQLLIVNGVFLDTSLSDPFACSLAGTCRAALASMPEDLTTLPRLDLPLLSQSPLGISRLRLMFAGGEQGVVSQASEERAQSSVQVLRLSQLVDDIQAAGPGIVLTMGKGGVGKTTVACAIALELARRGCAVHLTTTDPAANVAQVVGQTESSLDISRIDPAIETERYATEVRISAGAALDEQGKALLDEDLRSPCTEEIAVFRAFARSVAAGQDRFVIVDTAPTGHTILLLDAAQAFHREVLRSKNDIPSEVRDLLPRLRDPRFCRVVLVTLPEATPVHEAEQLAGDLKRAGIAPFAWVINQSWAGHPLTDHVLLGRQAQERPFIEHVCTHLSERVAVVPWQQNEPVGMERLLKIAASQ
jgi:arsenite-transporting ATPase